MPTITTVSIVIISTTVTGSISIGAVKIKKTISLLHCKNVNLKLSVLFRRDHFSVSECDKEEIILEILIFDFSQTNRRFNRNFLNEDKLHKFP